MAIFLLNTQKLQILFLKKKINNIILEKIGVGHIMTEAPSFGF